MTSTPDLAAPRCALVAAQAARETVGGRHPGDPERREVLEHALAALQQSWTADHAAYMRTGSRMARAVSDNPVHVLRRQMRAEEKRLRSALNRTSGTPRRPKHEPIDAKAMWGYLGRAQSSLAAIAGEHADVRRALGSGKLISSRHGGHFVSMADLNAEAGRLLEELTTERRRLKLAWERYDRGFWALNARDRHKGEDVYDRMRQRLDLIRQEADVLAAELRASAKRRAPVARPRRREPWTVQTVEAMLAAFERQYGRPPTKRELNSTPGLPYYTTVRRLLGPSPLTSR